MRWLLAASMILAGCRPGAAPARRPTLAAFAVVEAACGVRPGGALAVAGERRILVRLADPRGAEVERVVCLLDRLHGADLTRRGVEVALATGTAP